MTPMTKPPSFGIARRIAALFALVGAVLAALAIYVKRDVDQMHDSLQQVAEEQRETDATMYLLHHVRMLDLHARRMPADPWLAASSEVEELRFHADNASATLRELRLGPRLRDPSSSEHARIEERLYTEIERGLASFRTHLSGGSSADAALRDVAELLRSAEVLNAEVHAEEARAGSELGRGADAVRAAVFWAAIVAFTLLLAVLAFVHRAVVRPLLELRASAGRIGAGELSHRVAVRRRDEVGELAQEFNRMASELEGIHADLERRVADRTREFLRAARLAGLGTMAAGIAHEINNPLASIASCAEGLGRRLRSGEADPEEQREYLEIIAKEAYRAREITSRLLEFARSEPGPVVEFRADEALRDIEILVRHRLRERELTLALECDPDLPPLRGQPGECKQVLLNLIHNAIDASPTGARIWVRCQREENRLRIEVEDQGPGLPPQVAERAFDPFFTTKPPGKGTGLGLSIVERIVAAHHGRVDALNTGHGALLRVSLPLPLETVA